MTTIPTTTTLPIHVPSARPPAGAGATPAGLSATSGFSGTVDPIKLLKKYKWPLLASMVVGAALGTAAHFLLLRTYPRWQPKVLFLATPPFSNVAESMQSTMNQDEMNRFMRTEAIIMSSDTILSRVTEDPQLQKDAPKWCKQYMETTGGIERFDSVTAGRYLEDGVEAKVLPNSFLIQLSMTDKDKFEATSILKLVREKYQALLNDRGIQRQGDMTKALTENIAGIDQQMKAQQTRRDELIRSKQLDAANDALGVTQNAVNNANQALSDLTQSLERAKKLREQLEAEIKNPAGPSYGDDIIQEAEGDPVVRGLKDTISTMEGQLQATLNKFGREHRDYKELEGRIDGFKQSLESNKAKALDKLFNGRIEEVRKSVQQLESSKTELEAERETNRRRLVDLTEAQRQLKDIEKSVEDLQAQKAEAQKQFNDVFTMSRMQNANRILLQQPERVPSIVSFPQLKILVPAGILIASGLVGGLLFLRELVDQRVKGPSDITMIPRTRLLGWVPDGQEDHAGKGAPETAFRDRGKGVVAESFRQLRGSIAKRINSADHRVIVLFSGMPEAGTSSVVSNIAMAFAASDKRVLVIDANFRRPAMHRILGLQDSPGLADALATGKDIRPLIQPTSVANLDLLSAGSKEQRVYERLATQSMSDIMSKAKGMYDLVLIDTAPAVVAGDALALAQRADASALVVRAMQEKRGMVARIRNELADAKGEFLGVIVNGVQASAGGYMKGNIKTAADYQDK